MSNVVPCIMILDKIKQSHQIRWNVIFPMQALHPTFLFHYYVSLKEDDVIKSKTMLKQGKTN